MEISSLIKRKRAKMKGRLCNNRSEFLLKTKGALCFVLFFNLFFLVGWLYYNVVCPLEDNRKVGSRGKYHPCPTAPQAIAFNILIELFSRGRFVIKTQVTLLD